MHLALVGTPNSGKTALFNALTGSRQKVANYPGVTVERKAGIVHHAGRPQRHAGRPARHLFAARPQPRRGDHPRRRARPASPAKPLPDLRALRRRRHQSAAGAAPGARAEARRPAADAGAQHVRHRAAGAASTVDLERLSAELGVPVVTSIAVRKRRHRRSCCAASTRCARTAPRAAGRKHLAAADASPNCAPRSARPTASSRAAVSLPARPDTLTARIDAVLLHPVAGLVDPAADPVRDVPGGVHLGAAADGADLPAASTRSAHSSTTRCPTACCRASCRTA